MPYLGRTFSSRVQRERANRTPPNIIENDRNKPIIMVCIGVRLNLFVTSTFCESSILFSAPGLFEILFGVGVGVGMSGKRSANAAPVITKKHKTSALRLIQVFIILAAL